MPSPLRKLDYLLDETGWFGDYLGDFLSFRESVAVVLDPSVPGKSRSYALAVGLTSRCIQALLLLWLGLGTWQDQTFMMDITPSGKTQYFMSSGDFATEQTARRDEARVGEGICNDTSPYNYHNSYCAASAFWCEENQICAFPASWGEVTKKGETQLLAYTYLKDTHYRTFPCSTNATCAADETRAELATGECQCWSQSNEFLMGVEGLEMGFTHEFFLPSFVKADYKGLNFKKTRSGDVPTVLFCDGKKQRKQAGSGGSVSFPVSELLECGGIDSLDEVNQLAYADYPPTSQYEEERPSYRMTGVEIEITLSWEGTFFGDWNGNKENTVCNVHVKRIDGYSSFGNDVNYVTFPTVDADGLVTEEYHDLFRRGIKITFTYEGRIRVFHANYLLETFTTLIVLIGVAPQLTKYVFKALGMMSRFVSDDTESKVGKFINRLKYENEVWENQTVKKNNIHDILASTLVNVLQNEALLASLSTSKEDRAILEAHGGEAPGLSYEQIVKLLKRAQHKTAKGEVVYVTQAEAEVAANWLIDQKTDTACDISAENGSRRLSAAKFTQWSGPDHSVPTLENTLAHLAEFTTAKHDDTIIDIEAAQSPRESSDIEAVQSPRESSDPEASKAASAASAMGSET